MSTLSKGRLVGRKYRLLDVLAQGGMGSVWVARHVELGIDVAIKAIRPEGYDRSARKRFAREAKAAAQLKSPHIVRVFDYGLEAGMPYIAMELLEGEDLRQRLDRVGTLSLAEAARVTSQAAEALEAAHAAGLVHRDVKPRNIFIAQESGREVVKLLDFGVAKDVSGTLSTDETGTGALLGSPKYMSPEQARGGVVDRRSDVWSLAVSFFEMVTGRALFGAPSVGDVLVRLLTAEPPRMSEVAPELPPELDGPIIKALSRERESRYETARGFADDVLRIADRHPDLPPVQWRPVDDAPRSDSFGRSHSTMAATGGDREDATGTLQAVGGDTTASASPRPWLLVAGAALVATAGVVAWQAIANDVAHPNPVEASAESAVTSPGSATVAGERPSPSLAAPRGVTAATGPSRLADAGARRPHASPSEPRRLESPARTDGPRQQRRAVTPATSAERGARDVQRDRTFGVPIGPKPQ